MHYTTKDWKNERKSLIRKFVHIPFIISYLVTAASIILNAIFDKMILLGILMSFAIDVCINCINLYIIGKREPIYENNKIFSYCQYCSMKSKFRDKLDLPPMIWFVAIWLVLMPFIGCYIRDGLMINTIIRVSITSIYNCCYI